ncbi:excalibur calcium-binding domain-containing protein [Deinococcus cellulosilyticus]|uniref:excalibur calcium-binding domain-containing protein n=1 Tax=Deinococcus cellulosilyticus TaxID=401558 RepID=UPI001C98F307|nr:excalibur calcium-binding domain-containing protein [Deinococcus cellulosilyticus]
MKQLLFVGILLGLVACGQPRTVGGGDTSGVYYANCDEVRAAGKAPLYRGQPGYRAGLDRDNDGIACE